MPKVREARRSNRRGVTALPRMNRAPCFVIPTPALPPPRESESHASLLNPPSADVRDAVAPSCGARLPPPPTVSHRESPNEPASFWATAPADWPHDRHENEQNAGRRPIKKPKSPSKPTSLAGAAAPPLTVVTSPHCRSPPPRCSESEPLPPRGACPSGARDLAFLRGARRRSCCDLHGSLRSRVRYPRRRRQSNGRLHWRVPTTDSGRPSALRRVFEPTSLAGAAAPPATAATSPHRRPPPPRSSESEPLPPRCARPSGARDLVFPRGARRRSCRDLRGLLQSRVRRPRRRRRSKGRRRRRVPATDGGRRRALRRAFGRGAARAEPLRRGRDGGAPC